VGLPSPVKGLLRLAARPWTGHGNAGEGRTVRPLRRPCCASTRSRGSEYCSGDINSKYAFLGIY
jgi:hypothetical protein